MGNVDHLFGTRQEDLDALPVSTDFGKHTTCQVCLEDFVAGVSVRWFPCGHCFHRECADKWLEKHSTCPVCKQSVS